MDNLDAHLPDVDRADSHSMTARAATAACIVLVAATVAGWLLASAHGSGDARLAALVGLACAKIYIVMAVFMGLARAPRGWHAAAVAWIALVGLAIFALVRGAGA